MIAPRKLACLGALAGCSLLSPASAFAQNTPFARSIAEPANVTPYPVANSELKPRFQADSGEVGAQPCAGNGSISAAQAYYGFGYLANQIAQAYDLTPFYQQGDEGQGQTIAVLELESDSASDIAAYQGCYGTHTTVNYIPVDGGTGGDGTDTTNPGTGEAALDIEQIIGLAPQATIDVYQAPNTASGILDAYQAMIANPSTTIISTSWGACETGNPIAELEEASFAQAAQDGISVLAAAGDQGSTDCGTSSPAVDDPASDPYITGVGGTTLPDLDAPAHQFAWNGSNIDNGVSGGGYSSLWGEPSWQHGAAQAAENTAANDSQLACPAAATGGYCRAVPDVSADADPYTGYYIYLTQDVTNPSTGVTSPQLTAEPWGGTSAAAPLWAAVTALIDASKACNGHNLGFLNPLLYQAAVTGLPGLTDITSGNNDNTADDPTTYYTATTGYDPVTGLGTPVAAALGQSLCATADTLSLSAPATEASSYGQDVNVTGISATDAQGHTLTYTATGLPSGLAINPTTGTITGTPSANANVTVRVTVTAANNNATKTAVIPWTVSGAPAPTPTTTTSSSPTTPTAATPPEESGQATTSGQAAHAVSLKRKVDGQTVRITVPDALPHNITVRYSLSGGRPGLHLQTVSLTAIAVRGRGRRQHLHNRGHKRAGTLNLHIPAGTTATNPILTLTYTLSTGRRSHRAEREITLTIRLGAAIARQQS